MARYAQYSIPLDFKVILSLLLLVVHSAEKRMGEKRMGKHCGNTHVTFQSVEDRKAQTPFYLPRSGKVKQNCGSKKKIKKKESYGFLVIETSVYCVFWCVSTLF